MSLAGTRQEVEWVPPTHRRPVLPALRFCGHKGSVDAPGIRKGQCWLIVRVLHGLHGPGDHKRPGQFWAFQSLQLFSKKAISFSLFLQIQTVEHRKACHHLRSSSWRREALGSSPALSAEPLTGSHLH